MAVKPHVSPTHSVITKPLLAGKVDGKHSVDELKFPLGATRKIDGIRAIKVDGHIVSRSFKQIPNHYIRTTLERWLPDGMDMEITSGETFQDCTGNVMREDGDPEFKIWVIDYVPRSLDQPYAERIEEARDYAAYHWDIPPFNWEVLTPLMVHNKEELLKFEEEAIAAGFEGVMVRKMDAPYKCGRSTFNEQILIKVKRFCDQEAVIRDVVELQHNDNVAEKDAFGRTKRSTKQENLRPAGTLGALVVEGHGGEYHGIKFNVGTGFDQATRDKLWADRKQIIGRLIKVTYFPTGTKDAPRFPTWAGFRDPKDT